MDNNALNKAKIGLLSFIYEASLTTKYTHNTYVNIEDAQEMYMSEEEGQKYFERLYGTFNAFINNKDCFDYSKYIEVYKDYLNRLVDFVQSLLDGKNHIYAACYYFEYAGRKYSLDIERVAQEEITWEDFGDDLVYCNVVEFENSYNFLDKRVELIFVYDIKNDKVIDLLSIIESVCEDSEIKISKALVGDNLKNVNKKILRR